MGSYGAHCYSVSHRSLRFVAQPFRRRFLGDVVDYSIGNDNPKRTLVALGAERRARREIADGVARQSKLATIVDSDGQISTVLPEEDLAIVLLPMRPGLRPSVSSDAKLVMPKYDV